MKIKDVCTYAPKSNIKAGDASIDGQYMFFTSSEDESKKYGEYQIDGEGIIMGTGGNATLHYYNGRFAVSTDCVVLLPDDRLRCKYLYYFYLANISLLEAGFKGAGLKHTNKGYIGNIDIEIPSLEEQDYIVNALDCVFEIRLSRTKELALLDNLIKARFVEMFGDPETNPKGWKKEALKEHANVLVGFPFPSEGYTSEGIDIVGGYNLMQGYIQWDDSKHWPNANGYEQYLLQANDIVMAMDRPWVNGGFKIARVDINHLPALLIQRTACIRGKDLEQEFLHFLLDTQRFAEHCNITGSLVPHISNKDINSFQVIVPPIDEQKRFTAFVAQVDKSKFVVQQALDKAQLLFDSLMQKYFG